MRMTARAAGPIAPIIALVTIAMLVAVLAGAGCGKKADKAAAGGPGGGMPGMAPGGGGMPGMGPGGGSMPGMSPGGGAGGGMAGMPGMSPGGASPGGAAPGGASPGGAAPAAGSGGGAPAASPTVTAATPAPAPSAAQLALVDEALWTLRVMMTPNVPPPHPSLVKARPPALRPSAAGGGAAAGGGMGGGMSPGGMGGGAGGGMPGGMSPGGMGGGMPGGMSPGGMGGGMPGGMSPGGMGPGAPGGGKSASRDPFHARDYRFAQGGPGGPPMMGPGGAGPGGAAPGGAGPAGGTPKMGGAAPAAGAKAAGPREMTSVALALAIKQVAQKTRGLDFNDQRFYHEYWFLMAKSLLDEVGTAFADFPVTELSWAAQTRADWEGYLWHWGTRKLLEQANYSSLQDAAKQIAKARVGLAAIRAICKYGLLMHDVDETRYGKMIFPTLDHTVSCIQFAFGNPNYDPATIKRDETQRSRLMVEMFDNYLQWGHNWRWERSRNWAYLARYSGNLPTIRCDSCGKTVAAPAATGHQTWRCSRCGKALRPAVPGTWDTVDPYTVRGYTDDYRVAGMRNPATDTGPGGKYQLKNGWNAPTYQRLREGYRNAQRVHEVVAMLAASNLPTKADKSAMDAWVKASPKPEKIPEIHRMELEAHEMRLRPAAEPGTVRRQ
jgi:hypothetical protein